MTEASTRISPAAKRRGVIIGMQLIRGLSCLAVVIHHALVVLHNNAGYDPWWSLRDLGSRGVELFFVLSGFIILYAHWHDEKTGRLAFRYTYSRITRILPFTIIVATGWLAVVVIAGRMGFDVSSVGEVGLPLWLSSAFIVPMLALPSPIVIWTLRHEVVFYSLFALSFVSKKLVIWLVAAWAAASLLITPSGDSQFLGVLFLNLNILFLFGMGIYFLWENTGVERYMSKHPYFWFGLAMVVYSTLSFIFRDTPEYENLSPIYMGLGASFVLLTSIPLVFGQKLTWISNFLGDTSLSVYLVHFPVIIVGYKGLAMLGVPPALTFAVLVVAGMTGGFIFYHLVEAPILAWSRKHRPASYRAVKSVA